MVITQIHYFRSFKNGHDLYISKSQHSLVRKNYNVVVFHISGKNNGWDGCAGFTKLTTDLQNTLLIHNTLLVLHDIFCWYADPPSAQLYLQFSYSLFWFWFGLCKPNLYIHSRKPARQTDFSKKQGTAGNSIIPGKPEHNRKEHNF